MNPLLVFAIVAGGAWLAFGKKTAPAPTKIATIPTPAGPITVTTTAPPVASTPPSGTPGATPPITVTLPTAADYPSAPASGDLSPLLTQSEQYALANYTDDQLYNEGMSSGHLAYVAAVGTKLAADGDTRAGDLTLRVANWGK